jgi:two-component system, sensor histidine kinase and response regulator
VSASAFGWKVALVRLMERAVADPSPPQMARPVDAHTELDGPQHPGPRVLVVDDNPDNLEFADDLLRRLGITPTLAEDGVEAVALAGSRAFDLILMDLQMPLLDGLAATKRIRVAEHERLAARVPVLAYTSHALDRELLRDCGLDGVLDKPCTAQALQECLLRWCARGLDADGRAA